MKNIFLKILMALVLFPAAGFAVESFEPGTFGLSLNYPGAGFRYYRTSELAVETRVQAESDGIVVGGLRFYKYFYDISSDNFLVMSGFDAEYIRYKSDNSEGFGYLGGVFFGGEYFLSRKFAVQIDLGPGYMQLKDAQTQVTDDTVFFNLNASLNFYFR